MNQRRLDEASIHPSVVEALRATFGRVHAPLEPLGGGLSNAKLFKVTIGERRYVLRHAPAGPERDPSHELACVARAAERGIAPRVLYADVAHGVCISECIDGVTLGAWLRAGHDCIEPLGALLRALHDGPRFPRRMSVPQLCAALLAQHTQRGIAPPFADELGVAIARTQGALPEHVVEAPCHHDLNPGNVLVAHGRLWLIDWELAGAGDPFHDLATPGIFVRKAAEAPDRLLRAYLGREPGELERARLALARALGLTFYALLFARVAAGAPPGHSPPAPAPDQAPPSPIADPARFGEQLARQAQQAYASAELAEAFAVLAGC